MGFWTKGAKDLSSETTYEFEHRARATRRHPTILSPNAARENFSPKMRFTSKLCIAYGRAMESQRDKDGTRMPFLSFNSMTSQTDKLARRKSIFVFALAVSWYPRTDIKKILNDPEPFEATYGMYVGRAESFSLRHYGTIRDELPFLPFYRALSRVRPVRATALQSTSTKATRQSGLHCVKRLLAIAFPIQWLPWRRCTKWCRNKLSSNHAR